MPELIANPESQTPALVGGAKPIEPWSVEQDADTLMDELFADLERAIEGGTQLPRETVAPKSSPIPALELPSPAPLALLDKEEAAEEQPPSPLLLPQEDRPQPPQSPPPAPRRTWQHFDKILFGLACAALLGAIAWLLGEGKLDLNLKSLTWPKLGSLQPSAEPPSEAVPLSEADTQFANYMRRSLDLIDSQAANPSPEVNANQSVLPPSPASAAANRSSSNKVEYIPVPLYPSLPGTAGSLLPPNALEPPAPKPSPKAKAAPPSPTPTPSPAATIAPSPKVSAKAIAPAPVPSVSAPPPAAVPAPAPAPAPAAAPLPAATAPPAAPEPPLGKYSLVGSIVTSDGRSAALFNFNGTAQRVRRGEAIGDSGWTLYSVSNQSAVVRRNGEVREIYVGQKF